MVALHVCPSVVQDLTHISGGISHGDGAIRVVLDVILEVALNSSNVHGIILGGGEVVHNLIGGEESESVGESLEVLDDSEDTLQIVTVVRCPWRGAVDTLTGERRIDIEDHVDTSGVED